eukprot:5037344-Alexandrium_andersonii.AAC.1
MAPVGTALVEAFGGAVGQAGHELLEGPRRRDFPCRVLEGRRNEGRGLPIVARRGEGVAKRLGVGVPRLRASYFRTERRIEDLARDE